MQTTNDWLTVPLRTRHYTGIMVYWVRTLMHKTVNRFRSRTNIVLGSVQDTQCCYEYEFNKFSVQKREDSAGLFGSEAAPMHQHVFLAGFSSAKKKKILTFGSGETKPCVSQTKIPNPDWSRSHIVWIYRHLSASSFGTDSTGLKRLVLNKMLLCKQKFALATTKLSGTFLLPSDSREGNTKVSLFWW